MRTQAKNPSGICMVDSYERERELTAFVKEHVPELGEKVYTDKPRDDLNSETAFPRASIATISKPHELLGIGENSNGIKHKFKILLVTRRDHGQKVTIDSASKKYFDDVLAKKLGAKTEEAFRKDWKEIGNGRYFNCIVEDGQLLPYTDEETLFHYQVIVQLYEVLP